MEEEDVDRLIELYEEWRLHSENLLDDPDMAAFVSHLVDEHSYTLDGELISTVVTYLYRGASSDEEEITRVSEELDLKE